jgi:acid phosphatase (class A)
VAGPVLNRRRVLAGSTLIPLVVSATSAALAAAVDCGAQQGAGSESAAARPGPDPDRPWHVVSPNALVLAQAFGPPPEPGSIADDADRATVRAVQAMRSAETADDARRDAELGPLDWAAQALGPRFVADRRSGLATPATAIAALSALLAEVRHDFDPYAHRSPYPRRPRPAEVDASIEPLMPVRHGAYPSARAAATTIWGEVLGDVIEAWRAPLRRQAGHSAWLRVIAGVHYPTDLEAGRRLGIAFVAALRRSPTWSQRVAMVRAALGVEGSHRP